jgi:hypothetical protein
MRFYHLFSDSYLTIRIRSQASNDYDPSFVSEALREIQYSDTPDQDINMLKNVAVQAYMGKSVHLHPISPSFWLTELCFSGI